MRNRPEHSETRAAVPLQLRLFVAGEEPNSVLAKQSLREICESVPENDCSIEIVDVLTDYQAALDENILITPALIIQKPKSRIVVFGNLTDRHKVLAAMQRGDNA